MHGFSRVAPLHHHRHACRLHLCPLSPRAARQAAAARRKSEGKSAALSKPARRQQSKAAHATADQVAVVLIARIELSGLLCVDQAQYRALGAHRCYLGLCCIRAVREHLAHHTIRTPHLQ